MDEQRRRKRISPATTEPNYNDEQLAFIFAVHDYARRFERPFPAWSEVLQVAHSLGYRKVAEAVTMAELIAVDCDVERL